jgi:uncharacterized protein YdeI (YjbR/CyaY-like superfamily)
MKPTAFRSQAGFAAWLRKNHASATELSIRLFKVHARHRGVGYREALDESLCWGWIDGVRRGLDADSFTQRFTPRKPKSIWSRVNVKRFKELLAEKRVRPPGLAAFKRWDGKNAPYSFESRPTKLAPAYLKRLKANTAAWTFFSAQAPWYQRTVSFLVMSAKRPETRESRFTALLESSARGARIRQLTN